MRIDKEKTKEKEGEWIYNGEFGEWYWTGENEPDYGDIFTFEEITEEDKRLKREAEKKEFRWFSEERTNVRKEKTQQKCK